MLKKALSSIASALTGKKAEAPADEQPQTEATPEPTGAWPFPGSPPEEKAAATTTQRKKRVLVKREEEPAAPVTKKTPKQIAAERRKAEAQKDQARAKKVKK